MPQEVFLRRDPHRDGPKGEFLQSLLENTAKPRLKPRTYADYKHVVDKHLVPTLGRHQLRQLPPPHVQALLTAKAEKLSARRVGIIRAVLQAALNDAAKWSLMMRNVATPVTVVPYQIVYVELE